MHLKKTLILLIILTICTACSSLPKKEFVDNLNLNDFIQTTKSLKIKNRQKFVDQYFDSIISRTSIPYIQDEQITFVYRGKTESLQLGIYAADRKKMFFTKIEGTDFFYYTGKFYFEKDARVNYSFGTDDNWITDPLNPYESNEFFRVDSELRMPLYKKHTEADYNKNIPHGKLISDFYKSKDIVAAHKKKKSNKEKLLDRPVDIYLPPNYDPALKYKVIYFNDGAGYIYGAISALNTLDYMIYNKEIEPVIGVFVTPLARIEEYMKYREEFADYFVNELMPEVESKYSIIDSPDARTVVGDSAAGHISAFLAYTHPEKFGNVLSHSGALGMNVYFENTSYGREKYLFGRDIVNHNFPVKIYIVAGNYEYQMLNSAKVFYKDMKHNPSVKGVTMHLAAQGHHQAFWRDTLREGLIWLSLDQKNEPDTIVEKDIKIEINKALIADSEDESLSIAVIKLNKSAYLIDNVDDLFLAFDKVVSYETLKKDQYYTNFTVHSNEELSHYLLIPFKDKDGDGKYNINEIRNYAKTLEDINSKGIKHPTLINKEFSKYNFEGFLDTSRPDYPALSYYVALSNLDEIVRHNSNF